MCYSCDKRGLLEKWAGPNAKPLIETIEREDDIPPGVKKYPDGSMTYVDDDGEEYEL